MNIQDFWPKRNLSADEHGPDTFSITPSGEVERPFSIQSLYLSLVVILVATLAFGLGRLSAPEASGPVEIRYDESLVEKTPGSKTPTASAATSIENISSTSVVASSKGTKYHYLHCPGAKQISEKNKIVFDTPGEAESAGYTLAANCQVR